MVPVPDAFHPALVTVITIFPDVMSTAENILIWPAVPAANVAVSEAAVVKYDISVTTLAAPALARSSDDAFGLT